MDTSALPTIRLPVSMTAEEYALFNRIRAKLINEENKNISIAEVIRRSIKALAASHNIV